MKFNRKIAAVALASVMSIGVVAGCGLVTTDSEKDMNQVVAEVDITKSEDFATEGKYSAYKNVVGVSNVYKRDLAASFMSEGYQYVQNGNTYADTFDTIKESLVNRKMIVQYAKVYLLENKEGLTVEGYNEYVQAEVAKGVSEEVASLKYFLTEDERALAEYELKTIVNRTLDSLENDYIKSTTESSNVTVRTLPTGVGEEAEGYYDPAYKIYTGMGKVTASDCGTYEAKDGSTPTTRKKAYNSFLTSLSNNYLVSKGENVAVFEELKYYESELISAYEDALIDALSDLYEEQAAEALTEEYINAKFNATMNTQSQTFADIDTFEGALDKLSDTSFVLYAPDYSNDAKYGFVINILLPFSKTQKDALDNYSGSDEGYAYRASLLKNVKATDQRESWITGDTDYSYEEDGKTYFFKDYLGTNDRYETIKNYAGTYAFNGTVTKTDDGKTVKTNKIDIDDFINIMEAQLNGAGISVTDKYRTANYYNQTNFKNADGSIDYAKFVYYRAKANVTFNANNLFVQSDECNKAMSVVNELSFAYNTDTAGLNSYLGYTVSAFDTSFVSEFEYAAKLAVEGGAGTYTVAPSTYGWHVMYCTFAYSSATPYTFNYADVNLEGSFSNLYYEALKASAVKGYSSAMQTKMINNYSACVTVYEDRYADLSGLDND